MKLWGSGEPSSGHQLPPDDVRVTAPNNWVSFVVGRGVTRGRRGGRGGKSAVKMIAAVLWRCCDPESVGHMQPVPITKSISIKSTSFSTI